MFKFEWVDRKVTTKEKGINIEINLPSIGVTADLVTGLFSGGSSKKKISSGNKKTDKKHR